MDAKTRTTVEACTRASDEERMSFPDVVARLSGAGVERYHTDLLRAEKTYYLPDGASHVVAAHAVGGQVAQAFSPAAVEAAVRTIQAGRIGYNGFCEAIAAAGCVGYLVSLTGRRAVYYGRTGETYVEPFPTAP
jgi:uncharacterized protein YbcV (DUF1398 family)